MDLSSEIIILIVILVAALLYSKRNKWFGVNVVGTTQKQTEAIAFYRREFENLSTKELIRKDNEEKMTEKARIAIDQLLSERSADPNNFIT